MPGPSDFPLMLFAAGFGNRMGELTKTKPKPLVTVAGKTLLDHALELADHAKIEHLVVNLHYRGKQIADHLTQRKGPAVLLSWERDLILETGGGLRAALPLLGGTNRPVMTLNTDSVWSGENPLTQLASNWNAEQMDVLLLLMPAQLAHSQSGRGDFVTEQENIRQAPRKITGWANEVAGHPRQNDRQSYLYLGAQIINPLLLSSIEKKVFSLSNTWERAITTKRAYGIEYPGKWCDVGYPEGIVKGELMLSHAKAPHVF